MAQVADLAAQDGLGQEARGECLVDAEGPGKSWDEDKVAELFPKLAEKYEYTDGDVG